MIQKKGNSNLLKKQSSFSELRKKSCFNKLNLSQSFIEEQQSFSNLNLNTSLEVQNLSNQLDNIVRRRSLTSRNSYQSQKYFSYDNKQHPIFNCFKNEEEQIQPLIKNKKSSQNNLEKDKRCEINPSYLIKGAFEVIQESCLQQEQQDFCQQVKVQIKNKQISSSKIFQKKQLQNLNKFQKQIDIQNKKNKQRGSIIMENINKNGKSTAKAALQQLQKMGQQLDVKKTNRPSNTRIQNSSKVQVAADNKSKVFLNKYQKQSPKVTIQNSRQPLHQNRIKTTQNQQTKQLSKNLMKKSVINTKINLNQNQVQIKSSQKSSVKSNQKQEFKKPKSTLSKEENQYQAQTQIFEKIHIKQKQFLKQGNQEIQPKINALISNKESNFMKPTQMISFKQKQKLMSKIQKVKGQLSKNQVQIKSLQQIDELLDRLSSLIN